ncbi:3-deoxy-D-manno-octulosonic acid transferase [Ramlibacter sp. G-1-2-2]|uniref:3-deoxy-D-manno-octulosonic acid transferase n=1 Tax=Ramlibacter agri TaxID=2728837 RepID=A0A848H310_9BURK|nr:3-deoxy-D-manno-octulosonic acid transferase [Ramlibacter agri]NML44867.1 3-deoxy-D-manno-octulosonic acid transferase [Ramlibacter agri]
MIRPIYSLMLLGAQPLLRRKLRRRGVQEPGYLEHVDERFGRYQGSTGPGRLWIHAVSLGETRAAAILITALRAERPDVRLLLTHGTATGRAEGAKLLREGDAQAWLPWDTPKAVRGFLNHWKPAVGVLMETEVWPNLIALCREQGVPLALANARLSEKSLRGARRLPRLSRPAYGGLRAVWAQTETDARRLAQAGATVQGVFGNLKFDAAPAPEQLERGRGWRALQDRPVVMFASSREGEEAGFLQAARSQAGVQWLLVPRHPQRFDEVAALAAQAGFRVSRRSGWGELPASADVWIGDSLGEMALYYAMADVALLGGSFAPLGGQNLIEAAACDCPVVMGPHTFNFNEAAQLAQQAGAALRVSSIDEGVREAVALAREPGRREVAVEACEAFSSAHRGAALKTARAVLGLLERPVLEA